MGIRRGRRGPAGMLTTAMGLLLVLGACGVSDGVATVDGGNAPDATPTPSAPADPEDAMLAFADCMRDHGVDMPDPIVARAGDGPPASLPPQPEIDFGSEEFAAAEEACRPLLPAGGMELGEAPQLSEDQEQALLAFAECMRENGIDMPDPQGGGFIVEVGGESAIGFDPSSAEFRAAEEACREHLAELPMVEEGTGE
jgi:hypothetical protein